MSNFEPTISVCRHCQSYQLEGRRGGFCSQLGTPVQGCWKACCYAIPPFAPSWEVSMGINSGLSPAIWSQSQDFAMDVVGKAIADPNQSQELEHSMIEVVGACISDDTSDKREFTQVSSKVSS